ncbi:MAG: hypothetical protein IPH80_19640 [Myxococcales bacterium]|nr:hypothetical protein [Myxococcales bacterium]
MLTEQYESNGDATEIIAILDEEWNAIAAEAKQQGASPNPDWRSHLSIEQGRGSAVSSILFTFATTAAYDLFKEHILPRIVARLGRAFKRSD